MSSSVCLCVCECVCVCFIVCDATDANGAVIHYHAKEETAR